MLALVKKIIFIALIVFPRSSVAYALYPLSIFFVTRDLARLVITIAFLLSIALLNLAINNFTLQVDYLAFLIEGFLLVPFFVLFIPGCWKKEKDQGVVILRWLSVTICGLSVLNMVLNNGFPFRLPYIHFLPDAYSAFYGLGGAKIVTVIGFLTLLSEFFLAPAINKRFFLAIALSNFLIPSYLIGIASGLVAIGFVGMLVMWSRGTALQRIMMVLFGMIVAIPVSIYGINRYENLNDTFMLAYGMHAKLYAYYVLLELWSENPFHILFGVGVGQFGSTGALWANPIMADLSSHSIALTSYLTESTMQKNYLSPALQIADYNSWAISSSMNRPYSSLSVLLAEIGLLPMSLIIFVVIRWWYHNRSNGMVSMLCIFLFVLGCLDNWHDKPWVTVTVVLLMSAGAPYINRASARFNRLNPMSQ